MSFIVLLTASVITSRNATQFQDILTSQLTDKNTSMAQSSLTAVESKIKLWHGQLQQSMRFIAILPKQRTEEYLNNLVNFEKDFVAIHLIKVNDKKKQETISFAFTQKKDHKGFGKNNPENIKKKIFINDQELLRKIFLSQEKSIYLLNEIEQVEIPVLTIAIPAVTGKNEKHWANLSGFFRTA